jgi:hypothetical protein
MKWSEVDISLKHDITTSFSLDKQEPEFQIPISGGNLAGATAQGGT